MTSPRTIACCECGGRMRLHTAPYTEHCEIVGTLHFRRLSHYRCQTQGCKETAFPSESVDRISKAVTQRIPELLGHISARHFISSGQAQKILGMTRTMLKKAVDKGMIFAIGEGMHRLYLHPSVEAYRRRSKKGARPHGRIDLIQLIEQDYKSMSRVYTHTLAPAATSAPTEQPSYVDTFGCEGGTYITSRGRAP